MKKITVCGNSNGPIVYIWDACPIDSSGTRLVSNLSDYFPSNDVTVFLWDREAVGSPVNESFEKYKIVKIPCMKKMLKYGIGMSGAINFAKEYHYFLKNVAKFLESSGPSRIILAEWKCLGLLNYITCSDLKVIYLVKDMPERLLTKFIETGFLMRNSVDAVWTHSPYFNSFYKRVSDKIHAIRVVPQKTMFEKGSNQNIIQNRSFPFKIIFNGIVRYIDNLIATCDAVEDFNGQVEFHVYGYGPDADILVDHINNKNLKHTIYHGPYDYEKTPELIKNHDCVSNLYSKSRNARYALANKLYEAILFERPILATQDTKTCEVITRYGIGACVKNPKDSESVRSGIEQLLAQKSWDFTRARQWIQPYETEFLQLADTLSLGDF